MATRAQLRQRMGYTNAAGSGCAGDPCLVLVAALKPPLKGPPLQQSANRLANALQVLGVQRGDRVAIVMPQQQASLASLCGQSAGVPMGPGERGRV